MTKQISILGCGWLGLPLAKFYRTKGVIVKGSTTSSTKFTVLKEAGIHPYQIVLGSEPISDELGEFVEGSEVVVINFPPRRVPDIETIYPNQLQQLITSITKEQKVIFISSTSVYQNTNAVVSEELKNEPEKASGKAVLQAEKLLQERLGDQVTILRFAGLIGYDRLPGRFLANKKEVSNGGAPVNVIHQDDCIGLINAIIDKNCWGEIINGCADKHPLREEYYSKAAEQIGLTPPTFKQEQGIRYKIISNEKSKTVLGYTYIHPDPLKLIIE